MNARLDLFYNDNIFKCIYNVNTARHLHYYFQLRLGDTSLVLEVEKDLTVYGDELKFGGGKVCDLNT